MKKGIVGKKIGMTQIFAEDGRLIPVTVIQAGPCPVVQKKTVEKDGYEAIQVGFDEYAENRAKKLVNKPMAGHFEKWGVVSLRFRSIMQRPFQNRKTSCPVRRTFPKDETSRPYPNPFAGAHRSSSAAALFVVSSFMVVLLGAAYLRMSPG